MKKKKKKLSLLFPTLILPLLQSFSFEETNFHFYQFLSNFLRYSFLNFLLFYSYNILLYILLVIPLFWSLFPLLYPTSSIFIFLYLTFLQTLLLLLLHFLSLSSFFMYHVLLWIPSIKPNTLCFFLFFFYLIFFLLFTPLLLLLLLVLLLLPFVYPPVLYTILSN